MKVVKFITLFLFFLFFFLSFLCLPLKDYDFWWHLSTGKYIVENRSLPQNDPFTYTSHDVPSDRKMIIMKGNWLAETIFYTVYQNWDSKGIIILKSLLLFLNLFFILLNIRKQNTSMAISLLLLGGVFLASKTYSVERPQLFTFLVFSMVFYFLEDFRITSSKKIFAIPVLVLILANMHPGYIVCLMLIALYLTGEGILYVARKGQNKSILGNLLIVFLLTLLFSLVNPNGTMVLKNIFFIHGEHIEGIIEFMPTFYLYGHKIASVNYSYIIFLIVSLLSLRYARKLGVIHMMLLIVFTYMSLVAIRYVIFYMFLAAPLIGRMINTLREEKIFARLTGVFKGKETFQYIVLCIVGAFLVFSVIPSFARNTYSVDTTYFTPEGAADFLSEVDIQGNMFNEYGFGGYLIWRLYPEKKVFIDGRGLEPDVYKEYQKVVQLERNQPPTWDEILKKYDITYIVTPPLLYHGGIFYLVEELFESEEWVLIYMDHLALIFVRNDTVNSSLIKEYAIDKREGFNTIIFQASARAMKDRENPYILISLGKVFFRMGKLEDAEKAFMMARERDPDNERLKFWMQKLEKEKKRQEKS